MRLPQYLNLDQTLLKEQANWMLWIPVIFACGIIFYFSFPSDSYAVPLALLFLAIFVSIKLQEDLKSLFGAVIAIFLSGFLWSQFYDFKFIKAPVITSKTYGIAIAKIDSIKEYENGSKRFILSDLEIYESGFKSNGKKPPKKPSKNIKLSKKKLKITKNTKKTYLNLAGYTQIDRNLGKSSNFNHFKDGKYQNPPKRISLHVRSGNAQKDVAIGDVVKVKILLQPLSKNDTINNFDFEKYYYFRQIGGSGFAIGNLEIIEKNLTSSWRDKINIWRYDIAKNVEKNFADKKEEGAIFSALLLGIRDFIPSDLMENIRKSGLAHLLAISGLHLSLAAAIFFVFFRFTLTRFEYLTLHFNIKKVAAILAIISAFSYLMIAGAPTPAIRAFFMISTIFLAILFDQNSNPLRSLSLAAMLILIINPGAVFLISFQMSFGAILALITFYNFLKKYQNEDEDKSKFQKFIYYFLGICASSIIAQIALAPLVIYYFNDYALFGVLANLIAIPLTTFIIMPLAFIYLLLIPFGLEFLTIYPLDFALSNIIKTANYVANLPLSHIKISLISTLSLILTIIGFLWLCLWQERWRYFGIILIIIGSIMAYKTPLPNLIIDGKRQFFAIYNEDKGLFFSKKVRQSMRVKSLIKKLGEDEFKIIKDLENEEIFCEYEYCQAKIKNQKILILTQRNKIDFICKSKFDILVNLSKFKLPICIKNSKQIINNHTLKESGSQYFYF